MPARLTIHFPRRPCRDVFLSEGRDYVLGRGEECDLRLDDPGLSRRHASLRADGDVWILKDLGSKNGVTVEGRPVSEATLDSAAWLGFGGVLARFERVADDVRRRMEDAAQQRRQSSLDWRATLDPGEGRGAILERVLDAALEFTDTERGFVMLAAEGGDMEILCNRGIARHDFGGRDFSGSVGAIELALRERRIVVTCDAIADRRLAGRPSVELGGIRALICAPLTATDRLIGALYADSRTPGKVFTELDTEILGGLAEHAALAIGASQVGSKVAALARLLRNGEERGPRPAGERPSASPPDTPARGDLRSGAPLTWSAIRAVRDTASGDQP